MLVWTIFLLLGRGCLALDDWDQYRLIWQDEFAFLDSEKWQHEITAWGGGNGEFQLYTPDPANSFVRNGKLHIKPTLLVDSINPKTLLPYGHSFMTKGTLNVSDNYGRCTQNLNDGCYRTGAAGNIPPVVSARLRTAQKFNFTFGRVVISAKMPVGDWLFPAIWMLPENWVYGDWPGSGEIDLIEIIGNRDFRRPNGEFLGIQKMGTALHWGPAWDDNHFWKTVRAKYSATRNFGDNFHKFVFDWSANGMRFFVDDEDQPLMTIPDPLINQSNWWVDFWEWGKPWKQQYTNPWTNGTNLAPFDQAFHFLLNVAVGGTGGFIPDGCVNRGGNPYFQKPWNNSDGYVPSMKKFYNARDAWKWTWDSERDNNAMKIDYIRVYQRT